MKYKAKPYVIDAFYVDGGDLPDWLISLKDKFIPVLNFKEGYNTELLKCIVYPDEYGAEPKLVANKGEYIVRDISGKLSVMGSKEFNSKYEIMMGDS